MTREMIKQVENDYWKEKADPIDMAEVFDLANKALEQEPCEDCISREKVKQFLYERLDRLNDNELYDIFSRIIDDMYNELPSVTPQLSSELVKNSQKLDCISREQALKELKESAEYHANDSREEALLRRDRDIIRALPSVTPQEPKIGQWREDIDNNRRWDRVRFYCSECGDWQTYGKSHYCPNCGAKMVEPQESEDI